MLVMPTARSGKNIRVTCPFLHEICKKVLSVYFSHSLPYIETIISTSECN